MSLESNSGAPAGQADVAENIQAFVAQLMAISRSLATTALFDPSKVYSANQLVSVLQVSPDTIVKWKKNGLKPMKPCTKSEFFDGQDVRDFMRQNRDLTATRKRRKAK